jgi:hypothetical protein
VVSRNFNVILLGLELILQVAALRDDKIASEKQASEEINKLRQAVRLLTAEKLDLEDSLQPKAPSSQSHRLEEENRILKIQIDELNEKLRSVDHQPLARTGSASLFSQLDLKEQ